MSYQQTRTWIWVFIGLLLIAGLAGDSRMISLVWLFWGLGWIANEWLVSRLWPKTHGRVTDIDASGEAEAIKFKYYVAGVSYDGEAARPGRMDAGADISVHYDPDRPAQYLYINPRVNWLALFMICLGIAGVLGYLDGLFDGQ